MKVKVLCNVLQVGDAYGKKGDIVDLPSAVVEGLAKRTPPIIEVLADESETKSKKKA